MLKMLYDTLLLKEFKEESKIVVADHSAELAVGVVEEVGLGQVGIGNGVFIVPMSIKKGDKVIFIKDHALRWKEYWICKERDVLGVEE